MQGNKSKRKHHKKKDLQSLQMFGVSSHSTRILPINARISCNTHQSEFRATSTRPLFMGNTHHLLFMCNTHLSGFLAIHTNLNSVQQAHFLYSWTIRTILCSCAIRTCLNFVQYAPIWISCNKHTSFIHGQYAPYSCLEQYALTFIGYTHPIHILEIHPILGQCVLFKTLRATRLT